MSVEWFLALIVAYYIDQVFTSGKHPFFFLVNLFKSPSSLPRRPTVQRLDSKRVFIDMDKHDVTQEVWEKSSFFFAIPFFHISKPS